MAELTNEKKYEIYGFSGMQQGTSRFLRKQEELEYAQNVSYVEIGSLSKKLGYAQRGSVVTSTSTTSTSSSTSTTSTSSSTTSTSSSTSTS